MTAWREGAASGELGRLRASHADREQAVGVLKAAFVQGRLTKDEFDLRVSQVFAARTYADLEAPTADIPAGVTSVQPPERRVREPGRMLSFHTAVRVGAVGATPSMASAAATLAQHGGVPAAAGILLVALTGVVVTGLLTALLMLVSWAVRRSRPQPTFRPPSGPAGLDARRRERTQLPSAGRAPWPTAQTARTRPPRARVRPQYGPGRAACPGFA